MMASTVLAVVLPLAASLISIVLGRRAPLLIFAIAPASLIIAWRIAAMAPALHALGGWEAPLGIVLRADGLAASFIVLSAIVASAVGIFGISYLRPPDAGETRKAFAFWPLFYAAWAAINAVFLSRDLFNIYVALELLTLSAIALVALDGGEKSLVAAMRYLLFALFGSLAFLIGTGLLFGAFGTLDLVLLGERMNRSVPSVLAAALISTGLLAKTALFPLHVWLPQAHSQAPAPASALLSALVVKASFYILFRLWFDVLSPLAQPAIFTLLGGLGAMAVIYGGVMAMRQKRLKMIVAYSTVAQLGYLFLVFPLATPSPSEQTWAAAAWSGTVFHGLAHGLAKAAMFLAAGTMILSARGDQLENMTGVGRSVPIASTAFAMAAVSLIGLPPSGGFTAKYLMLTASFASGQWWWAGIFIAGGLLSAAYLLRPLNVLMRTREEHMQPLRSVHWSLEVLPLVLAVSAVLVGVMSMPLYQVIEAGSPILSDEVL